MNNLQHQETVRRAVKRKFRGKESISAKGKPLFPETAEREFVRLTNGYMRMLNQTMKDHLPVIMAAYKDERRRSDGARYDEFQDIYLIGDDEGLYVPSPKATDISGKADKVSGATSGNFAALDANGNLTDSGKKTSDFVEKVLVDGVEDAVLHASDIEDYTAEEIASLLA